MRYSYGPRKKTIKITYNVVCASLDTVDPGYLQFEWLKSLNPVLYVTSLEQMRVPLRAYRCSAHAQ
jgi:hypothetical protein